MWEAHKYIKENIQIFMEFFDIQKDLFDQISK